MIGGAPRFGVSANNSPSVIKEPGLAERRNLGDWENLMDPKLKSPQNDYEPLNPVDMTDEQFKQEIQYNQMFGTVLKNDNYQS